MSGLYTHNFSPSRALSPQIRTTPDAERYALYNFQTNFTSDDSFLLSDFVAGFLFCFLFLVICSGQYLSELLAEYQKLGPFVQVLPICSRLLNQGYIFCLLHFFVKKKKIEFPIGLVVVCINFSLLPSSSLREGTLNCVLVNSGFK